MVNNNGERIKKSIIIALAKHPEGLTIKDLSEILNLHRQTVTKYVFELKGAGVIKRRYVGSATLHYLNPEFLKEVKKLLEGVHESKIVK